MYSLKNVLLQSPEKVKVTVLAIGGVICAMQGLEPGLWETVGVGIAVERALDLFYVNPVRTAITDDLAQTTADEKEAEALNGIELGKRLATTRPLHAE